MRARTLIPIFATLLALTGSYAIARSAVSPIARSFVTNRLPTKDPGPVAPSVDLDALAPYRNAGTDVIRVHPSLEFDDRLLDTHRPGHVCESTMTVELYPQTPYTMYMLQRWALQLDGAELTHDNVLPGLPGSGTADVPSILNPRNKKGVVRSEHCDADGWATFHVPDGSYFAVASMMWIDNITSFDHSFYIGHDINNYWTDDYDHTDYTYIPNKGHIGHIGDGYGVIALDAKVSKARPSVETPNGATFAVAHFGTDISMQLSW